MHQLFIKGTEITPEVNFSPSEGIFRIIGKSIPEDADAFYQPILDWLDVFSNNVTTEIHLRMELDFFNISSSKRILFLMYKLNEFVENGKKVKITWVYRENDDDMFEVGQDYSFMVSIPFDFDSSIKKAIA
jgi:hypothetical protein